MEHPRTSEPGYTGPLPTVAFVDDERFVLDGLRRLLRGHAGRWRMQFFTSAEAFWSECSGRWPDVAVLDLNMPGWSGLDLAKALRDAGARTRCIMLTGNAGLEDAMAFINEAAVFRYYMKPCRPDMLVGGVEAALAGLPETARTPDVAPAQGLPAPIADQLAIGTMLIDPAFRVVFANKAAMRLLGSGGVLATDPSNRLRATSANGSHALARAVQEAGDTGQTVALTLESPADGRTVHVAVSATGDGDARRITLFLNDPSRIPCPDAATLRNLFGLTGSESRIVECLVRGDSLEQAAEACGLKIASARTYLKGVFLKMGVTRQAELVQKALTASMSFVVSDGR